MKRLFVIKIIAVLFLTGVSERVLYAFDGNVTINSVSMELPSSSTQKTIDNMDNREHAGENIDPFSLRSAGGSSDPNEGSDQELGLVKAPLKAGIGDFLFVAGIYILYLYRRKDKSSRTL